MARYEYKIVPAPTAGVKAKGLKTTQARFAHALETVMNELGREGWDYVRADTLPCEERSGLTGKVTKYQNMLVFRRTLAEAAPAEAPVAVAGLLEAPAPASVAPVAPDESAAEPVPAQDTRVPSPTAAPRGPAEPPLSRSGGGSEGDASSAARAAAAAFRSLRGTDGTAGGKPPNGRSGSDYAAE